MTFEDSNRYEQDELIEAFDALFPQGFAGEDVRREVAPKGWANSPLVRLFHPTAEQQFEESVRLHRNLGMLTKDESKRGPEPKREDFTDEAELKIDEEDEISRIVGMSLWDIFSDNHEVSHEDGRVLDMGSFRASGGFIAEAFNRQIAKGLLKGPSQEELDRKAAFEAEMLKSLPGGGGEGMQMFLKMIKDEQSGPFGYMDFHMGTGMIASRADLTPVYVMIFRRLKAKGYDWKYSFPRLHLVDFRPLAKRMKEQDQEEPEWMNYSPEQSFAEEEEESEKDREISEMREKLDEGHREAVAAAQDEPPPTTVSAYEFVYGDWPAGWPPEVEG